MTYVGYVHEHREHEVEVCSGVEECFSDLIPLPGVITDALRIAADSINCDSFLSVVEPSNLEL